MRKEKSHGGKENRERDPGRGNRRRSWYDSLGNKPKDAAYINKMYDGSLESQKQTLASGYENNVSNIDASMEKQQKATDANLNRTYVESAKAAKNYGEVQNAYGLSSGAMAQARLAQDNQLQADLTALRAAQTDSDAQFERQRNLLAKEYSAAIAKAQADNDYQRAQALYNAAKADEDQLMQMQKEAGNLMAGAGDYSILAKLYGLTDEQLAMLKRKHGGGGGGGGGSYRRSGGSHGGTNAGLTAEELLALMYGDDKSANSPGPLTGYLYENARKNDNDKENKKMGGGAFPLKASIEKPWQKYDIPAKSKK